MIRAKLLPTWIAVTDPIEALFDGRKPLVDPRLGLVDISEDIRPVVFNPFADKIANIERVDPLGDPFAERLEPFRRLASGHEIGDGSIEALRQIADPSP